MSKKSLLLLETGAERDDGYRPVDVPSTTSVAAATPDQIAAGKAALQNRLATLNGIDSTIRIDFGPNDHITVDCNKQSFVDHVNSDGRMYLHPDDLRRIIDGTLDVRCGMIFSFIRVTGNIPAITKFCDKLSGKEFRTELDDELALPEATDDTQKAKRDLATFGYCMIRNALSSDQVAALRERLCEQAAGERDAGVAWLDGLAGSDTPPSQRVWNLQNKGRVFVDLLKHPLVDEFMIDILGPYYLVSNYIAVIAGPGSEPQVLHTDQIGVQPNITEFPVGLNILWFLDDVNEKNGGTRLLPGSHNNNIKPANPFVSDGTISATGPAGTALIFETRLWHGTGANQSDKNRHILLSLFYRNWMRQGTNSMLAIHPDVLDKFDDKLRVMHGFRCTTTHGAGQVQIEGEMLTYNPDGLVGELKPAVKS